MEMTGDSPAAVGNHNDDGRDGNDDRKGAGDRTAGDLAGGGGANHGTLSKWPWGAQFAAVMTVLVLASFLLIVMPVLGVMRLNESSGVTDGMEVWGAMLAALLGLTTMTISAILLFMTLRIDRGARAEARKAAEKEMKDATKKAREAATSAIDNAIRTQVHKAHDTIDEKVKEVKEVLEKRVRAVDEIVSKTVSERISGLGSGASARRGWWRVVAGAHEGGDAGGAGPVVREPGGCCGGVWSRAELLVQRKRWTRRSGHRRRREASGKARASRIASASRRP